MQKSTENNTTDVHANTTQTSQMLKFCHSAMDLSIAADTHPHPFLLLAPQ